MKIRNWIAAAATFALLVLGSAPAYAEGPYQAYVYDEWNHAKASPNSYLPESVHSGMEAGGQHFNEPQDLFVDREGSIYVADTGNNRIVKLDGQFKQTGIIDKVTLNGKETKLNGPTGIYKGGAGSMYIADKGSGRVLVVNAANQVQLVIENPEHPLIAKDFKFKPVKVAADEAGRIYVLSEGQFFGLMQFDAQGQFTGYFGSNKVEVTPAVVLEKFWKSVMTKEQRESMAKLLPIEYSNLERGPDGFVYTTTIVSENSRQEIKKLNPLGNNVLMGPNGEADFGDKEIPVKKTVKQDSSFVDLAVNQDGFIAGLDRTRGRIFEYDQDGNAVAVFGALGNQKGTFLQPVAVAYRNESILVLDAAKRNITRFVRTEYGQLVHKATLLYNQGLYEDAAGIWSEASKHNIHNGIAYIGMAKALEKQEKYPEAMQYYKLGAERSGYSDTYALVRIQAVRTYLPVVMSVLALVIVGYYGLKVYRFTALHRRKGEHV